MRPRTLSRSPFSGIGIMKPSMKMGVIALIGICVVFYQYHLSTGVTFDQVTAFNADASADDAGGLPIGEEGDNYSKTSRLTEDMVSGVTIDDDILYSAREKQIVYRARDR